MTLIQKHRQRLIEALNEVRTQYRAGIACRIQESSELSYESIAREFCVSTEMVYTVAHQYGLRRTADVKSETEASSE